jgi:hypothetical protein
VSKPLLVLVLIGVALGGAFYYKKSHDHPGKNGPSFSVVDGPATHRFTSLDNIQDAQYALFGGDKSSGMLGEFSIGALPITYAKKIAAQYPDFYLCASPGASSAKSRMENLAIFPKNSQVYAQFREMLEEYNRRIWNNGNRLCFSIDGKELSRSSASMVPGMDIQIDDAGTLYRWIDKLTVFDCNTVI